MALRNKSRSRRALKRRSPENEAAPPQDQSGDVAPWFIAGMAVVALASLLMGCVRHGFAWPAVLAATGCLVTGTGFVAIGLLELEWLERIIGFVDGIFAGAVQWLWTGWFGTLSDSELVGRRGATVIWVAMGIPVFVWGCLMGLRIVTL
jgi:hypothetical protein